MPKVEQRDKATKYRYEAEWNEVDGWHFSFGQKKLWETEKGYIVADLRQEDHVNLHDCDSKGDSYCNQEKFKDLSEALEYMRTNKRENPFMK